jgi:GrpB-like predicted nucleotidyltransferase (UPF0157 family)
MSMFRLREIGRRIRMRLSGSHFDRNLDEEMQLHLELRQEQLRAGGLSFEEARAAARRRFGNVPRLREESADAWGWRVVDDLGRDIRHALRGLRRAPVFASVAILTLALGIGANTAILSIVRLTLRPDAVVIEPYSAEWPGLFRELAGALRRALGDAAIRIDHIGSTAVPGLAAKPIIDVQISVRQLEPVESYGLALVHLGYRFRPDNDDPSRRYFREGSGRRRTHVHVRQAGSPDEQRTLLFRDYLRADRDEMRRYEGAKRRLATQYRHRRRAYVDAKGVIIEKMLQRAEDWAHRTEWLLSPSDA